MNRDIKYAILLAFCLASLFFFLTYSWTLAALPGIILSALGCYSSLGSLLYPHITKPKVCREKAVREGHYIVCHKCGYKEFA